ncbi:squalene synthetase-like protein [Elasticomyces elasticus]|nr:squalene synthetase-like protein [Elasticomyces elasticus]
MPIARGKFAKAKARAKNDDSSKNTTSQRRPYPSQSSPYANSHGGNGRSHFSLADEAMNTERHHTPWSANAKLRYQGIQFVKAETLQPSEDIREHNKQQADIDGNGDDATQQEATQDNQEEGEEAGVRNRVVQSISGLIDSELERSESAMAQMKIHSSGSAGASSDADTSEEEEMGQVHAGTLVEETTEEQQAFFVDTTGSGPVAMKKRLAPPVIRSPSPTPSDSSEEVMLFRGRGNKVVVYDDPPAPAVVSSRTPVHVATLATVFPLANAAAPAPAATISPLLISSTTPSFVPPHLRKSPIRATPVQEKHVTDSLLRVLEAAPTPEPEPASKPLLKKSYGRGMQNSQWDSPALGPVPGTAGGLATGWAARAPQWKGSDGTWRHRDGNAGRAANDRSFQDYIDNVEEHEGAEEVVKLLIDTNDSGESDEDEDGSSDEDEEGYEDDSDDDEEELEFELDSEEQERWEDDEDLRKRRKEAMTDEQIARLLSKQEDLGMGSDCLYLFDGTDDLEGLRASATAIVNSTSRYTSSGSRRAAGNRRGMRRSGGRARDSSFPDAGLMADVLEQDPYGGFEVMDFERPSLRTTKRQRKGQLPPELAAISDEELQGELADVWAADRGKKASRKAEREQLRAMGLLGGKKGKTGLGGKYRDGMDLVQVRHEIRIFLASDMQQ